ncbi:MAG TPA: PAS domain S-box protein, partial [Anaerolineales bacterium]|nr:PAS domain S-box protein [Anaerolineales bacterium]
MKTKIELLAELEQAQKRIAELENALASTKNASEFPKDPVLKELLTFEKRFTALFRSNPIPVGFTRASDFRIVDVNDAWSTLTGYTREEALGHTSTELGLAKPKTLQHVRDMLQDKGEIRQNEILLYTRAGQERQVLISSEPIEIDGEAYFLNNLLDVTEQRLAEQKLRESEAVFRAFIDQSHDGIMLSDAQGRIIEWNPALAQISGLDRNMTIGRNAWDVQFQMMTPEISSQTTVEQLKTAMLNVLKEEHHPKFNVPGEFEIQTPQGERKFLAQTSFPIFSPAGYRLGAIVRDITARKQAEDKLRESQEYLHMAYDAAELGIWKNDLQTGTVEFDERARFHYGFETVTTTIDEVIKRVHPDDLARLGSEIAAATAPAGKGWFATEYRVIHPDGSVHWLDIRVRVLFDGEGLERHSILGFGTTLDITERKEAEQKVLASETLLRQVMESTQDSIFAIDRDYHLLLNNQRHQQVLVETGGHPLHVGESVLPPDYPQDVIDQWRELYDRAFNGEGFKWETEWVYTDGQRHVIESNFSPLCDAAGNITGALVVIHDITERKQSENALERARNTLEQAQKIAHMGSFEYIAATQTTVWSEEESRIYGLDPNDPSPAYEEMLQKMIHPDDADILHDVFTKAMQNNSVYELEHRVVQPDGSIRWVHDRAVPYLNEEGQLERYIGITLDITERKKAEQSLRETEERLALVMEGSQLGYWDWNIETGEVYRNVRWAEMLGYTLEEIQLNVKQWTDLHHPDDKEAAWKSIQDHLDGKTSAHRIEYRMRTKDGQYKWILDQARVVKRDPNGKPLRMSGTHTDITEQKQAEQKLRESEENYRGLMESLDSVVATIDHNGRFLYMNEIAARVLGDVPENLIGKTMKEIFPEPMATQQLEGVRWVIREGIG